MFEDSLIESTRHIAKRRGLTTLLSISMQMFVLMLLVIIPLLRTNVLSPHLVEIPVLPPYFSPPTAGNHAASGTVDSGRDIPAIPVNPAGPIPHGWVRDSGAEGPPVAQNVPICMGNCGGGVFQGFDTTSPPMPVPAKPSKPFPISHLDPGQIIRRVQPIYPHMATVTRTQGAVVLHAIISREGTIEQLQVLSGHPFLDQAALDAVKQWRFRPYILNGQPIEVETEITVNFILGGG